MTFNKKAHTTASSEPSVDVSQQIEYEYTPVAFDTLLGACRAFWCEDGELFYKGVVTDYVSISTESQVASTWINRDIVFYTRTAVTTKVDLAATPLDIPWALIEDEYKFAAQDKDGEIYLFTGIPVSDNRQWNLIGGNYLRVEILIPQDVNWETSLTKRPEGV